MPQRWSEACIATSNSRELVETIAEVHGLREYFSCIMTACDVKKGKPAPDIYLAVAERLGFSKELPVFEDIVPGIMAGKNAGMEVCAVEDAYSLSQKGKSSFWQIIILRISGEYYIEKWILPISLQTCRRGESSSLISYM